MKITELELNGLFLIEPTVFKDERGYFFESFHENKFCEAIGKEISFVQDNQSLSQKDVVRGLHLQAPPFAQGKLVRVTSGSVLDVAVDVRRNSETYGKYVALVLDDKNFNMLWIPEGFAHGFKALEENTIFVYKCTQYYNKASEMSIRWDDKQLAIDWKINNAIISEKDKSGVYLKDFVSPFN